MEEEKRFQEWIRLKSDLHFAGNLPAVKEGQVWWCALGENVGVEINGKKRELFAPGPCLEKIE